MSGEMIGADAGGVNVHTELAELAVHSPHLAQVLDSLLCPACRKRAASASGLCDVCENAAARMEADAVASGKYATQNATATLPDTFTPATFTPPFLHVRRHGSFDEDTDSSRTVFTLAQVQRNYGDMSELVTIDNTHVYVDAVLPEGTHVLLSGVLQLSFGRNRFVFTGYSARYLDSLDVAGELTQE